MPIRLQKILAHAGFGSRRACEKFVVEGRVMVDGVVVRQLGSRADPETQSIDLDGQKVAGPGRTSKSVRESADKVYYLLNKPRGVLCTNEDPSGRTLAVELVPEKRRIYCVGRLDQDTEGLIVLTNDGELTNQLTHPRYGISKTYIAKVAGEVSLNQVRKLEQGVYLAEGRTQGMRVRTRKHGRHASTLEITIAEGMNRQVRRALAKVNLRCQSLKRIAAGPLRLGALPTGAYREITSAELAQLRKALEQAQNRVSGPTGQRENEQNNLANEPADQRENEQENQANEPAGQRENEQDNLANEPTGQPAQHTFQSREKREEHSPRPWEKRKQHSFQPRERPEQRPFRPREKREERSPRPWEKRKQHSFQPRERPEQRPFRPREKREEHSPRPWEKRKQHSFQPREQSEQRPFRPREKREEQSPRPWEKRKQHSFQSREQSEQRPFRLREKREEHSPRPWEKRKQHSFQPREQSEQRPFRPREKREEHSPRPWEKREQQGSRPWEKRKQKSHEFGAGGHGFRPWEKRRPDRNNRERGAGGGFKSSSKPPEPTQ